MPGILRVGLTGGIACGRSTIGRHLRDRRGWLVLDADLVAHALTSEGGAAVERVLDAFGPGLRAREGGVDRRALGQIVFGDAGARAKLEGILHPMILGVLDADIAAFERRAGSGIVVVDAALIVETGRHRQYHRLVVAHCPLEVQRARLMSREGLTGEQAEARIRAQAPLAEKVAVADYLIDTGGTMAQTREEILRVTALLEEDLRVLPDLSPRRKGGDPC